MPVPAEGCPGLTVILEDDLLHSWAVVALAPAAMRLRCVLKPEEETGGLSDARSLEPARIINVSGNIRTTWGAGPMTPEAEARFVAGVEYCGRFFMDEADAQKALYKLTAILEAEALPYAIIGALALNEYGHRRVTVDVDLVMRDADLQTFKARWLGRGYAERTPGSGKLRDTEHGVDVDVLSTGRFPGDDKPKPIAFPDPSTTAIRGRRFALLPMPRFIELKLASGMVAPHRAKDLVDIQELIRSAALSREVAGELHPWVRDRFLELWDLAQVPDPF